MLEHIFINGPNSRTLYDAGNNPVTGQRLGDYDDSHQFVGGPMSASGIISIAEKEANPLIYRGGTTWLVKNTDNNKYFFGGDLNDPEPRDGQYQLSAVGWGVKTEETVIRFLLQNAAADQWQTGSELGYAEDAEQINVGIEGDTLLFKVEAKTEFKRGKAGNPSDWKSALFMWIPEVNPKRIKFTLDKKRGDSAYTLQLVASDGPGQPLATLDSWSLGGNANITVDKTLAGNHHILGLRVRRTAEKKKARGRRFRISGLKVWGTITQADNYSINQALNYLFDLAGADTKDVVASGTDTLPFDELQTNVGSLIDEVTSWESLFWTMYPNEAAGKHGKARPLGEKVWHVVDPHTPIRFLPARRYNKVSYQYIQAERNRVGVVTANPDPFPGESRTYPLDAGEPAGSAVMTNFAQQVADFLATERPTGSGTLKEVVDPANPGTVLPAVGNVFPGDTLVDTNKDNKSGIVSKMKVDASGDYLDVELAEGDEVLDRIINKRKMLLGQGKTPGKATAGALGIAEPAAPRNVKIRFNKVGKKNGVVRWNIRVKWDPVLFDVDDNGAYIRRYIVWIRPHFKGGGPVPEDQGGGWRKHHAKAHDDDDPNDNNDDCFVTYKNVEQARKWKWEAKVKAVDIYDAESAWGQGGHEGSHDGGGPPRDGPGTPISCEVHIQDKSDTVQVTWDSAEETDEGGDKLLDQGAAFFKIKVEIKEKHKGHWSNWRPWKQGRSKSDRKTFHAGNLTDKRFRAFVWAVDSDGLISAPRVGGDGQVDPAPGPAPIPGPEPQGIPKTPAQPPELHRAGERRAEVTWRYNPTPTPVGLHGFTIQLFRIADNEQRLFVAQHIVYTHLPQTIQTHTVEFGQTHIVHNKRYAAKYYVSNGSGQSGDSPWSGQKLF